MFRLIGQYEITRDDDIIRVRSAAEFNLEAAQQYSRDMMEVIAQMPPAFATLVEFDAPPIIGPEVEASMHKSVKHRAARGMIAVAFVTQSVEGLAVANAQWGRIYAGSGVEFRTFRDLASARMWLQELIDRAR